MLGVEAGHDPVEPGFSVHTGSAGMRLGISEHLQSRSCQHGLEGAQNQTHPVSLADPLMAAAQARVFCLPKEHSTEEICSDNIWLL